jgi:uncharacterized delta-60 repeat protein
VTAPPTQANLPAVINKLFAALAFCGETLRSAKSAFRCQCRRNSVKIIRSFLFGLLLSFALPLFGQAPGSVDTSYAPSLTGGAPTTSAVQADGRLISASPGGGGSIKVSRINSDGSIDSGFSVTTTGVVSCIAVLPDGKILIAGNFTAVNGTNGFGGLARLNANGTVDGSFSAGTGADNSVMCMVVQPDGKIVIGGYFTTVNNVAAGHIARLNANGSLDAGFNSGGAGTDIVVFSLARQDDGKLVLGGWFRNVNGVTANGIARLEANGTLDAGFNPGGDGVGAGSIVYSVAVQADGKIVVAGQFTSLNGVGGFRGIGRLNANGSLDTGFTSPGGAGNTFYRSVLPQADGKLLILGNYNAGSDPQNTCFWRLNTNGTFDLDFGLVRGNSIANTISMQPDGKVIIAGEFSTLNGVPRAGIVRFHNDDAPRNLGAPSASRVVWEREGAAQSVSGVTFEVSTDGGANWNPLGAGVRIGTTSNWELTGLSLPAGAKLRARSRAASGYNSGSSSLEEQTGEFPSAPAAVTRLASDITVSGATLSGAGSSNGLATNVAFQYSADATMTTGVTTTASEAIGTDVVGVSTTRAISGLLPHSTYYYRAISTNTMGTTNGTIRSFVTANTPPVAPNGTATATTGDAKTITLPFSNTDADGDTVTLSGTTPDANLTVTGTNGKDVTFTAAAGFVGDATLGYTVGDGFGGTASGTITVTISDNDAPSIDAPTTGLLVYVGTLPDFTQTATRSDNIGVVSITQTPPAGTATVAGDLDVTLTAKDAAANESSTTFTVTVRPTDSVPTPVIGAGGTPPGAGTADGPPADAEVKTFGLPAIDNAGKVAYLVQWGSDTDGKGKGLFTDVCLAKVGDDVAGITGATFKAFTDPVIDGGRVVTLATLAGVPKATSEAVLAFAPEGSPSIEARTGDVAPGLDGTRPAGGPVFKNFVTVALSGGSLGFIAQVSGGTGVLKATGANDTGLWIKDGSDPLRLALHEGDVVAGKTIKTLATFVPADASPGQGRGWLTNSGTGTVMALAFFSDKTQGIVTANAGGNAAIHALSGTINVSTSPAIGGATFASFSYPARNNNGALAFLGKLKAGPGGVLKSDVSAIFLSPAAGPFDFIARVGFQAPGSGGFFGALEDPVLSPDGGVAFLATLKGVKGLATKSLWWQPSGGSLTMLAQGGGEAGDIPGSQWKSFDSIAITDRGPIFAAKLVAGQGGVTAKTASGVWACDFSGTPRVLFRTGDIINGKTLTAFSLLKVTVGNEGVTRSFNNNAQVAWLASFSDKTTAIVVTEVP